MVFNKVKVFTIIFLGVVFLFVLFLVVTAYNEKYRGKNKDFIKKLLKLFLVILGLLFGGAIMVVLFGICYKIVKNLFFASILTIAISLMVLKFIDIKF